MYLFFLLPLQERIPEKEGLRNHMVDVVIAILATAIAILTLYSKLK